MPDIDSIYSSGGSYLKGDELEGCDDLDLTISGVEQKLFDDGSKKVILQFDEIEQLLVVNRTNALMIAEVAGSKNTDKWIGKKITLFATKVEYGGRLMNGIRVRPPQRKSTGKKFSGKRDSENPADGMDDSDVPF